ncbi:PEP-CTERM sorting domain-containing protein [Massilia soli]|nr:PEP-CTERM sorting domain-containing protein [Massilia soli]
MALAAPIYSVDTLLGSVTLDNSGKDELAMLRHYAGDSLLNSTKSEGNVTAYADDGQWFVDTGTATPGFFVLKFGTGNTGQDSHYFFKNDGAIGTNKLVWTNAQVDFLTGGGNCFAEGTTSGKKGPDLASCNIGRLSHYAFVGMITPPVDNPPPTDNPPTGNPPTDNPPTDHPPTDIPPTDVPPTDVPPTDIPEPGSLALAGLGLLALFGARKKLAK